MENAIVTFVLPEDETADLEVPVDVTAERLLMLLRRGLSAPAEDGEVLEMKEAFGEWTMIADDAILAQAGVRDGVYLRIRPKSRPMKNDADLPVSGWKPLF